MSRPQNSKYIFARRAFVLLILGFIHLSFLWHLDILYAYAITGFLLILFYDMELRSVKIWIVTMFLLDIACSSYLSSIILEHLLQPTSNSLVDSYSAGTYLKNLEITFMNLPNEFAKTLVYLPRYLFLFLIGLHIGKSKIYAETKERQWEIKTACSLTLAGTFIFIILWMVSVHHNLGNHIVDPVIKVFNFLLGSAYVALFVLVYHKLRNNYILERFRVIGKMTLTSYLSHSIFYLILFYDFSLGLHYEYPTYLVPVIAVLIFFIQAEMSRLWLNRFGQGPVEKMWRFFTYSKK